MEFIDHFRRDGHFSNRQPLANGWQFFIEASCTFSFQFGILDVQIWVDPQIKKQKMDSVAICPWNLLIIFDEMDMFPTVGH